MNRSPLIENSQLAENSATSLASDAAAQMAVGKMAVGNASHLDRKWKSAFAKTLAERHSVASRSSATARAVFSSLALTPSLEKSRWKFGICSAPK
jgi:hypothetical protein